MSVANPDVPYILANGRLYGGWLSLTVNRGLDRMCADCTLQVTEQWANSGNAWQLTPWTPIKVMLGSDAILTGYIDSLGPRMDPRSHVVTIGARSKTQDLVDCTPDIASGQFQGYTLEQIARGICKLFGIGVIVECDAGMIVQDATLQRAETAYEFLERLARMSAVLLTDDASGNLVLTRTGSVTASGKLQYGPGVENARARINVSKRFSTYIVKGQAGIAAGGGTVKTALRAVALDPGVPRYRPHVSIAESQLTQAGMQQRANWEMRYAFGRATLADFQVPGWRQPDGTLWVINQMVSVDYAPLQLDADMLIAGISYRYGDQGMVTGITIGPPEGYTPDPGEVRLRKRGKKHGSVWNLDGLGSANE